MYVLHFEICKVNTWISTFYKESPLSAFTLTLDFITQKHLRLHLSKHHALDYIMSPKNCFILVDAHLSKKHHDKYHTIPSFMELSADHQSSYSSYLSIIPEVLKGESFQVLPCSLIYSPKAHKKVIEAISKHIKIMIAYNHSTNYIIAMQGKGFIEKQVSEIQNMRAAYLTPIMVSTLYISAFGRCSMKFKSRFVNEEQPITLADLILFESALNEKVFYYII